MFDERNNNSGFVSLQKLLVLKVNENWLMQLRLCNVFERVLIQVIAESRKIFEGLIRSEIKCIYT